MANIPVAILAAGEATRLKPYSDQAPKCFMELEPGVTILDFIVERLRSLGLDDVYIVTRPAYSQIFREKLGDSAKIVEADLDSFGNLYSMGLAAKKIKGRGGMVAYLGTNDRSHLRERSLGGGPRGNRRRGRGVRRLLG